MSSVLAQIRDSVVAQLQSQAWAGDYNIPVLARRRGLVDSDVAAAVEGLRMPAIFVFLPRPAGGLPNVPAALWKEVAIEVQVMEFRNLNKSGIEAEEVAERVIGALHHWNPAFLEQCRHLWLDPEEGLTSDESGEPYLVTLLFRANATLAQSLSYSATIYTLTGLAAQLATTIDDAITAAGTFAEDKLKYWSTYDPTDTGYVRNATCYGAALDFTAASPYNSQSGKRIAATAITPRHVLMADHAKLAVGTTLHFVEADGTVHTRTLSSRQSVSGADLMHDVCVGRLDSDLPAGITPAKLVQRTLYADLDEEIRGIPVMAFDQEDKLLVHEMSYLTQSEEVLYLRAAAETIPARYLWDETPIGGDSGNPIFAANSDGEVGLLSVWSFATTGTGSGGGPFLPQWVAEVQALVDALGGGGTVGETEWSLTT